MTRAMDNLRGPEQGAIGPNRTNADMKEARQQLFAASRAGCTWALKPTNPSAV